MRRKFPRNQRERVEALFDALKECVGGDAAQTALTSHDVRWCIQELVRNTRTTETIDWDNANMKTTTAIDSNSPPSPSPPNPGYGKALISRSSPLPEKRLKIAEEEYVTTTTTTTAAAADTDSDDESLGIEILTAISNSEGSSPQPEYAALLQQYPIPSPQSAGPSFSPTCEFLLGSEWEGIENASHLLLLDIENIPDFFAGAARMEQSCQSVVIPPNCFVICCWGQLFSRTRFSDNLRGHVLQRMYDMKRIKCGCAEGGTSNASDTLLMWWVMDLCIGKDAKIPTSTPITLISGDNDFDELHRDLTTEGFSFTRFLSYDIDELRRNRNDYGGHDRQFFTQLRSRLNAKKGRVKNPVKCRETHVGLELDFSSQLSVGRQLGDIKKNMKGKMGGSGFNNGNYMKKYNDTDTDNNNNDNTNNNNTATNKNNSNHYHDRNRKGSFNSGGFNNNKNGSNGNRNGSNGYRSGPNGNRSGPNGKSGNTLGNYKGPTGYYMPIISSAEAASFPKPPKNVNEMAAKLQAERRQSPQPQPASEDVIEID